MNKIPFMATSSALQCAGIHGDQQGAGIHGDQQGAGIHGNQLRAWRCSHPEVLRPMELLLSVMDVIRRLSDPILLLDQTHLSFLS